MRFGTKNDNNSGNKESTFMYSDVGSVSYIRPSRPIYFPRRSGEAFYSGVVIETGRNYTKLLKIIKQGNIFFVNFSIARTFVKYLSNG